MEPKDMTNGALAAKLEEITSETNEQFCVIDESASRLRATDWQTIESAPRDGTRILVTGKYGPSTGAWLSFRWEIPGWLNREENPTHWQTLPPPPKASKAK